jgi:hypothetical protein
MTRLKLGTVLCLGTNNHRGGEHHTAGVRAVLAIAERLRLPVASSAGARCLNPENSARCTVLVD